MLSLLQKLFSRSIPARTRSVAVLIVGIGNVGETYYNTRHNIGFFVADALLQKSKILQSKKICNADVTVCRLPCGSIGAVAKPTTYVNRSGVAVRQLLENFKLPSTSCLVIVDDFHLTLRNLRFRRRGTDGGHNGLKSIITENGPDFPRLRVGIGPVPDNQTIVDFVLGRFSVQESEEKNRIVDIAADAVDFFCANGIESAMNRFNT